MSGGKGIIVPSMSGLGSRRTVSIAYDLDVSGKPVGELDVSFSEPVSAFHLLQMLMALIANTLQQLEGGQVGSVPMMSTAKKGEDGN